MTWRDDKANTAAQLANMTTATTPDVAYWEAQAYLQIKNILTGMGKDVPVDQDFTDIATAIADSDVQTLRVLRITTLHVLAATITVPVANFTLLGTGFNSGFTTAASAAFDNITVTSKDYFHCKNLRIRGGTSATGNGITLASSDFAIIENCWFDNLGAYAIEETGTANDTLIQACNMSNTITNNPAFVLLGANSYLSACVHTPYD